jgi:hypothetical protein
MNSLDLKYPPTAVGGITIGLGDVFYRKDLKYPPTAVGGITIGLGDAFYRKRT